MTIAALFEPLSLLGIGTAVLCGMVVGLERQLSGKPTGMRTSILICLGSYIFVAVNHLISGGNVDPGRIVGQIITGIGFIGAGVILTRQGIVVGVTSAAVIWVLAGIGILIGFEKYATAVVMSLLVVVVLTGVNLLESSFMILRRGIYDRFPFHKKKDPGSKVEGSNV
jgi:putative Mg2+ transporter-C (MgtC) family protein